QDGTVVLAGQVHAPAPEGMKPIVQEIGAGTFRREIRLPIAVDAAKAEATYEHGVLTLTLPKVEAATAKRIPIKVARPVAS
ncbi:MAG TPA: Hsp20/alpha crystallin family protein, partial [Chloroflexota bacterium]